MALRYFDCLVPGGMNTSLPSTRLPKGACPLLKNIEFRERGVWSMRGGYAQIGSTIANTPTIVDLVGYTKASGTPYLCAFDSANLYYISTLTESFTNAGSATQSGLYDFTVFNDVLIIARQTSTMLKFDGSSVSALEGSPPSNIRCVRSFRNFLFAAQNNSSRVYFSALGDAESWNTGADFFDVNKDDGDRITGLAVWQDRLLIFKKRSIYALSGYSADTFEIVPFAKGIGCTNHRSIQETGAGVFWQGEGMVYRLSARGFDEIGWPIKGILEDVNPNFYGASIFYPKAGQYQLLVDTDKDDQGDTILVFDVVGERWSKFTTSFASIATTEVGGSTIPVGGGYSDGKVYRYDYGTQDGSSNITCEILTQEFDCGNPFATKSFVEVIFWLELAYPNYPVLLSYDIDGKTIRANYAFKVDVANKMYPVKVPISGSGKFIQFRLKYTGPSGFHLGGLVIGYEPAGMF